MIHINKHEITASIKDRYANITYTFLFENTNQSNNSSELKFEMTVDPNAYISKFEADIDGELFVGKTKGKEKASKEYSKAKSENENAILISQPHDNIPNLFEIKTNIDSKSKIRLTIEIEQYIKKHLGYNELNIQILRDFNYSFKQTLDHISFNFTVEDTRGIYDIQIPSQNIDDQNMNASSTKCELKGKIMKDSTINELKLQYKTKGESEETYMLFDNNSNTFCHVISDIISNAISSEEIETVTNEMEGKQNAINNSMISRRVIFVIDRSGSMSGTKWSKTTAATIMAIKQLRQGYDRFNIVLFNSSIELLPYGEMMKECTLADEKSICDCIAALENKSATGGTNINDALLKAIELIKADILCLNNDNNCKYNFFMNQIVFITDGEPNNGEQDTNKIVMNVKNANDLSAIDKYNNKISIFSFGVGSNSNGSSWVNDLNHSFLKILSVNNNGFYQRIKQQSADTTLCQYFNMLSKPVLTNIKVQYTNKDIIDLTQNKFDTLYSGNDLIICGKINTKNKQIINNYNLSVNISAMSGQHIKECEKLITKPVKISKQLKLHIESSNDINNIERIWAYLTLQHITRQKLMHNDMIEVDDDEKKEDLSLPLSLAMKYNFVTPWTSMIVVKHKTKSQQIRQSTDEPKTRNKLQHVGDGLAKGGMNIGKGLWDGISGLVMKPAAGVLDANGLGKGLVGLTGKSFVINYEEEKKEALTDENGGLDSEYEMEITLKCGDMMEFKVPKDIVMQSALIKTMWSGDQTETEVPLPNVRGEVLKIVIKYMEMTHTVTQQQSATQDVIEWINGFDMQTISEIILTAWYLDIKPLWGLGNKRKAELINRLIDESLLKTNDGNGVIKIIDELLFVFDVKAGELKIEEFFVSNMIYLIRKIIAILQISNLCQYEQMICDYFNQEKVDGKVVASLIETNKFVESVRCYIGQQNDDMEQTLSSESLTALKTTILKFVNSF